MSPFDSNPFLPIRLVEIPRNDGMECGENLSIELLSNDHHLCLISAKIKRRIELLHRGLPAIRRSMKNLSIAVFVHLVLLDELTHGQRNDICT
jgi:hypothetical protein